MICSHAGKCKGSLRLIFCCSVLRKSALSFRDYICNTSPKAFWKFMKKIWLIVSGFLLCLASFSQDSTEIQKELKILGDQRSVLIKKIAILQEGILETGKLIDSCITKLELVRAELQAAKHGVSEKKQREIEEKEKILAQLNNSLDSIVQKLKKKQELIDQAKLLVKELDEQIKLLSS